MLLLFIRSKNSLYFLDLNNNNKKILNNNSFGGRSPERVASDALRTLFTFVAAKIVLAQLEGSGRGGLAAYDKKAYDDLEAALATFNDAGGGEQGGGGGSDGEGDGDGEEEERRKRSDSTFASSSSGTSSSSSWSSSSAAPPRKGTAGGKGDLWLSRLSRKNPALSLRVMEVRKAYAERDFEWDSCKRLATEGLEEANLGILKERLKSAYEVSGEASNGDGGGEGGADCDL